MTHSALTQQIGLQKKYKIYNEMELRSGRIVKRLNFTKKVVIKKTAISDQMTDLINRMSKLNITGETKETKVIKELKILFRFLFYEMCESVGIHKRIRLLTEKTGRPLTLDDLISLTTDESFWISVMEYVRCYIKEHFPAIRLLELFPHLMKQEYSFHSTSPVRPNEKYFPSNSASLVTP